MKGKKIIKKKGGANLVPPPGISEYFYESIDNNGIKTISFGEELEALWDYNNIITFFASNLNKDDIIEYTPQDQLGIKTYRIDSINENGKRIIHQIFDGQDPEMEEVQWDAESNFSLVSSNENINNEEEATMPYNPNQSQQMGGLKKKTKKKKKNYLQII